MEGRDRKKIERLLNTNFELRKLYDEHELLERKLERFSRRNYLTSGEEQAVRELKSRKLRGVDRMMVIIHSELRNNKAAA